MCPNGTPMVDVIHVDCAMCGAEVDEETTTYGICEKCWADAHTFDNAIKYGAVSQFPVKINGLFAKVLTPEQIDEVLRKLFFEIKKNNHIKAIKLTSSFLADDDGDFADWLKEQKGKE